LIGGNRAVVMTTLGICAGLVVHALAAAGGLSALLKASATAYGAVKVVGGIYLVYLGIHAIRASLGRNGRRGEGEGILGAPLPRGTAGLGSDEPEGGAGGQASARRALSDGTAFRQALISNVVNPKLIVFFISVLPQFVSEDGSFFAQVLVLGLAFEVLTAVWLLSYGAAVARLGEAFRRPVVRRFLERLTGSILIALGLRVAVDGGGDLSR
jgi:threonine/homoserine/homoserine lactone efflux protein